VILYLHKYNKLIAWHAQRSQWNLWEKDHCDEEWFCEIW